MQLVVNTPLLKQAPFAELSSSLTEGINDTNLGRGKYNRFQFESLVHRLKLEG